MWGRDLIKCGGGLSQLQCSLYTNNLVVIYIIFIFSHSRVYFQHVVSPWIHGASPASLLQINKNVEKFKVGVSSVINS